MTIPKVFISATTQDLKSYRQVAAEWARTRGYEPVVQDEFPVMSDYGTIVQMLREKLDPCDAVIHLAGLVYGFEPKNHPNGENRRSYTQLEYELGKEHKRQVFCFMAKAGYTPDNPISQSEELAELQRKHRERLMEGIEEYSATSRTTGNELYYEFSSHDELQILLDEIEIKPTLAKPQNLPLVGSLFKGRDEFIEQLRSVLVNKPTYIAAVTAKQAIHGLGGVGKTRVAVEYAKRFSHEYTALLFIAADNPSNLHRNLANLCGALVLNLPEKDVREQEVQVAAALRWLREHSGWFLIVDNVDTPEAAEAVEGVMQQLDTGHVVVTSRLSQWGHAVEELSLDVISEIAAREFLLERTAGKRKPLASDPTDATALATVLGCLPLALEQSGAFIAKHGCSFQEYCTRWKAQEAKVITWFDQRLMKYSASVATTWQTSFDQLSEDGRNLLNVVCWLAPDPIPLTMLSGLPNAGCKTSFDIESAIADLAEYSLCKWTNNQHDAIEVHRLVEDVTRYRLSDQQREGCLKKALEMLVAFLPREPADVRGWPEYRVGQPHLLSAISYAEAFNCPTPTTWLMSQLGIYLHSQAENLAAESLMTRCLAFTRKSLGEDHPDVAAQVNNLAQVLKEMDRLEEVESLMGLALRIAENSYGEDHPVFATALANFAQFLHARDRSDEAEPLFHRALGIMERTEGTNHPSVATILANLAQLWVERNRLDDAESLMRRALDIVEQRFGTQHPTVSVQLNNLAQLYQTQGRFAEAEPMMRRALAIDEQSYETEHPNIAIRLNNLAQLLRKLDRDAEAAPLMFRAISIDERAYGPHHPRIAVHLGNLAWMLRQHNRMEEAEVVARRALLIDEESFGVNHPKVALDLNNLSQILKETSRTDLAESLLRRAIDINVASFGCEHPSVATCLGSLGLLQWKLKRYGEAESNLRQSLTINEKSFGDRHSCIAVDSTNLALVLEDNGCFLEAELLFRRALEIDQAIFGVYHSNVAVHLSNLAGLLCRRRRFDEAEPLMCCALAIDEAAYGTRHPKIANRLNNLAALFSSTDRLSQAEPLLERVVEILQQFCSMSGYVHPDMPTALQNYSRLLLATGLLEDDAVARIEAKLRGEP